MMFAHVFHGIRETEVKCRKGAIEVHFGMRSTINSDRERFYAGYAAAKAGARS